MKPFALLEAAKRAAPDNPFVQSCVKHYVHNGKLTKNQVTALQRVAARSRSACIGGAVRGDDEPLVACTVHPKLRWGSV